MAKKKVKKPKWDVPILLYLITLPITLVAVVFSAMIDVILLPILLVVWIIMYFVVIPRKI